MRVINAVSPVTAQDKMDLQAALDALAAGGNRAPTFAEIRAAFTAGRRARFTDGFLHQVAVDMNLKVVP